MAIYSATFSAVAATAAQDLFEIAAPANSRVRIREIRIGQYSDFGDAQAELISILVMRGHTTTGSGGSSVTPAPIDAATEAPAAGSTVKANNTTVAANGSPVTLVADAWNVAAGWWYYPPEEEQIVLAPSQRLVVRITAPADSITVNGTLLFEEARTAA